MAIIFQAFLWANYFTSLRNTGFCAYFTHEETGNWGLEELSHLCQGTWLVRWEGWDIASACRIPKLGPLCTHCTSELGNPMAHYWSEDRATGDLGSAPCSLHMVPQSVCPEGLNGHWMASLVFLQLTSIPPSSPGASTLEILPGNTTGSSSSEVARACHWRQGKWERLGDTPGEVPSWAALGISIILPPKNPPRIPTASLTKSQCVSLCGLWLSIFSIKGLQLQLNEPLPGSCSFPLPTSMLPLIPPLIPFSKGKLNTHLPGNYPDGLGTTQTRNTLDAHHLGPSRGP